MKQKDAVLSFTHNSQLITHPSPLTPHHSPLTTHHSILSTSFKTYFSHYFYIFYLRGRMLKMTLHSARFWFMALALILSGCKSSEYFTIDILEPASMFLPTNTDKLLIAHNAFPDTSASPVTIFVVYGETFKDTALQDSLFAGIATRTLADMLNLIGKFDAEVVDSTGVKFPKKAADFTDMHVKKMRELCKAKNADAFVLLNNMTKDVSYDIYFGDFGNTYGEFMVTISAEWLMINPFTSKLIDEKTIYDTLYFPVKKPLNRSDFDNYSRSVELLIQASEQVAVEYGSYISPHYAQTERMVFIAGDKNIKKGYANAKEGKWKEAAWFWREALSVPDNKVRAKASFNLALANEMEGLLDPALEWARESYRFFPDTINKTYIRILEERIKVNNEIILQMEGK